MPKYRKFSFGRDRKESGMTLMEVLIAVAVLGILGAAFMSTLGGGIKATVLADERTVAESLARTQMEAIRNAEYDDTFPYDYDYAEITNIPEGYAVSINPDPLDILWDPETQDVTLTDLGFQKITVTVFHGEKQVFEVVTYKEER